MGNTENLPALVLGELQNPGMEVREALRELPNPGEWDGHAWRPWGMTGGMHGSGLDVVRAGRSNVFFKGKYGMYDTLRDAFVGERMNRPTIGGITHQRACGCIRSAPSIKVRMVAAAELGHVDCEAQLEQMRVTMRRVLLESPRIDLVSMTEDVFAGQAGWREHYLWWLEREELLAHVGAENQSTLMLTQEGASALVMLEMTRPGSNIDMSAASHLEAVS